MLGVPSSITTATFVSSFSSSSLFLKAWPQRQPPDIPTYFTSQQPHRLNEAISAVRAMRKNQRQESGTAFI